MRYRQELNTVYFSVPLASYGPDIFDVISKTWFFNLPLKSNEHSMLGLVYGV